MPHSLIFWLRNECNPCAVPNIISILLKVEHATLNIQFVYGIWTECYLNLMSMNQKIIRLFLCRAIHAASCSILMMTHTHKEHKKERRLEIIRPFVVFFLFFFFSFKMLISFRFLARHCSLLNLKSSTSRYIIP